jgi:ABC-2 type transport system permease protein
VYRTFVYAGRDLTRWLRSPMNVLSTLAMPAAWLLFMGLVIPSPYEHYLDYITPGILVLTMLTAGLSGGTSLMFDKTLGYLNKFLALPSPRESILFGKIIFITVKGLLQSTIILLMAIAVGATVLSPLAYLELYLILFIFGVIIAAFGTTVALYLADYDSYAAAQAFISIPLYLASSALVKYADMPTVLYWVAKCNPMSYAIDASRIAAAGSFPGIELLVLIALAIPMLAICSWKFKKATLQ